MYPALVNCTTIDWFSEWPNDALLEVADKYLEEIHMANDKEVCILSCRLYFCYKLQLNHQNCDSDVIDHNN